MIKFLFETLSGDIWAFLGAGLAFFLSGIGSSIGVGTAGGAAAGVVTEDSDKFVPCMILEALPSTQAIYGFVVAFMISGNIGGLSLEQGLGYLMAALPAGIVGLVSAIYQGKVASASIGIVARRSEDMVKGVIFALMVELFAIFGLLISIILVGQVPV
jgi:V/A-type H+-transporting ATPase subunit K